MVGLRHNLLLLGTTVLLFICVECQEDNEAEEGTCSATNPSACSTEQQANLNSTMQLTSEGNALAEKGDHAGALKLYQLALKVDSSSEWSANPMINAGLSMKNLGRRQEAVEMLRKGVKLNPTLFHGQYNLAVLLAEDMVWKDADAAFSVAMQVATADVMHHVWIGWARLLLRLFHYEEGRAALAGRDILDDVAALSGEMSGWLKKREKPETDLVSLCSNIFMTAGKVKEAEALHSWAVKKGIWMDAQQRPSNFDMSFARTYKATPWWKAGGSHDLPDFLDEISDGWKKMQKELDSLMQKKQLRTPLDTENSDFQWYDQSKGHEWLQLDIFQDGQKNFGNAKIAKTAAKLFSDTQVKGDDQARVFYSALMPGTQTFPRCGLSNTRLTCYLGLRVPNVEVDKHGISVAGEVRGLKEGAWACFDDSFEHTIWNKADEVSGTVVVQFKHPAVPKQKQR